MLASLHSMPFIHVHFLLYIHPVVIEAYPNTQPVPLGTTVVLECRVVGDSSTVSYQWRCPNGACDVSSESRVTPRSRIVNGNTLTVNVVSESDGGEYRCTVTEGGNTQTSSYNITVSGMHHALCTDRHIIMV